MTDNRNTILAVILSGLVLIAWQYFYNVPQMEKQRAQTQTQAELAKALAAGHSRQRHATGRFHAGALGNTPAAIQPTSAGPVVSRETAIAATAARQDRDAARSGSISLKGARIDDIALTLFRDNRRSQVAGDRAVLALADREPLLRRIRLGSRVGLDHPDARPEHDVAAGRLGALSPNHPVTLKYDNGEGLTFKRSIAIDERYLFTIKDDVTNVGNTQVTLYPFALISRHGTPEVSGYYILHEGLIGYLGDQGLQEYPYKKIDDAKRVSFNVTNGWLGITDKYWPRRCCRRPAQSCRRAFRPISLAKIRTYQTDYLQEAQTIPIGGTASANARLFAGAKEASVVGINFRWSGLAATTSSLG